MTGDNHSQSTGTKIMRVFIAVSLVGVLVAGLASPVAASGQSQSTTGCGADLKVGEAQSQENIELDTSANTMEHSTGQAKTSTVSFNAGENSNDIQMTSYEQNDIPTTPLQQNNASSDVGFCDIKYIGSFINAVFTVFISGALVLGLMTWVVTSFTESLPLPQDMKTTLKKQRNSSVASMLRAVFVPAIIVTLLDATNLVIPDCISILPF